MTTDKEKTRTDIDSFIIHHLFFSLRQVHRGAQGCSHRTPTCGRAQPIHTDTANTDIHGRHVQIHPASKFLICPRFIANDSVSVGYTMSLTIDFFMASIPDDQFIPQI
jgi:hypothetical protein